MLPSGWAAPRLGQVLHRIVQPVTVDASQQYREIGIRSHGRGIFHKPYTTGSELGDKRVFWVVPDALILNIVFAWEQAVAVTKESEAGMIASHRFPMYRPKDNQCDVEYLRQYFCTKHGKTLLGLASPGGAGRNKTLGNREFESTRVPMPDIREQKRIVEVLSTWDQAIVIAEKLVRNLQSQKSGLTRDLLTGRKRLASSVGPWSRIRLDKLCTVRRGASPRPIDDPKWFSIAGRGWVRISDVTSCKGRELISTTQYLSDEGANKSVKVDPGDLVMSICASIGVPKKIGIPACIHDGFVVFRDCAPALSLDFLYYYLEFVAPRLVNTGQAGAQKNLNTSIVGSIEVPHISRQEQEAIVQMLVTSDEAIKKASEYLTRLKAEKAGLMQQLLTGKRRVQLDPQVVEGSAA